MARKAGTLAVALTANSSPFERAMYKARGQVKSFAGTVKTAMMSVGAAFGAAQVIGGIKSLVDEMGAINDRAGILNISVERYQEFAYAAKQVGADMGTVESAMKRMDMTLGKAVNGDKAAIDAFRALGLSVADIRKLKPDELFDLVAKSLAEIQDPAERSAAQVGLFGKNGAELNNFLREYLKLGDDARQMGLIFSAEDVAAADALGDSVDTLGKAIKVLVANTGLVQWLNGVAEGIMAVKNLGAEASGFLQELARRWVMIGIDYSSPIGLAAAITAKKMGKQTAGELAANSLFGDPDEARKSTMGRVSAADAAKANTARQTRLEERAKREEERARRAAEKAVESEKAKAAKTEKVKEAASSAAGDFSIAALARSLIGSNAPAERTADATEEILELTREQTQMERQMLADDNNSPELTYS